MATRSYVRNGTRNAGKYSIVDKLNERVLAKLKPGIRSNARTQRPRKLAFATLRSFTSGEADELEVYLGKALNFLSQPAEFREYFTESGEVDPAHRSKFVFLPLLDRYEKNFAANRNEGTNIRNANVPTLLNFETENFRTNGVLKQFYNTRQKHISLAKGTATTLLNHLVGPDSPLLEEGYEYIVLHANSIDLAFNYYAGKFEFRPLYGVPKYQTALNNPFETLPRAPPPPGLDDWDVRVDGQEYVRKIGGNIYSIFDGFTNGPIMYRKIGPRRVVASAAAAPVAGLGVVAAPAAAGAAQGGRRKTKKRHYTHKRRVR